MNIVHELVSVLGLVAGCVLLFGALTIGALNVFEFVTNRLESLRYKNIALSFIQELDSVDRWCSYDYPIVEDITKYLRNGIGDGCRGDVSRFRDELRKKYLTKPETGEPK